MADGFSVGWSQAAAAVGAVGGLGLAAFGLVESVGKAFAFSRAGRNGRLSTWGLPYVGFGVVKKMMRPLTPALELAYGDQYFSIIAQQYRAGRASGQAPDTIRQGVKLALPFLGVERAAALIAAVWKMDAAFSRGLANALQAPALTSTRAAPRGGPPRAAAASARPSPPDPAQVLAGRFAAALDARVSAAFDLADERYEAWAKTLAGVVALVLALVLNYGLGDKLPWALAVVIGLVAVPLAPVAKDVSTKLNDALTAFQALPGRAN